MFTLKFFCYHVPFEDTYCYLPSRQVGMIAINTENGVLIENISGDIIDGLNTDG